MILTLRRGLFLIDAPQMVQRRAIAVLLLAALIPLTSASPGCARRKSKPRRLWTQKQANREILKALEADFPDQRRQAVESIRRSKYLDSDDALQALRTIVRTDRSDSVRRAAARTLGDSGRRQAFEPLIQVLDQEADGGQAYAPGPKLKRTILDALNELLNRGLSAPEPERLRQVVLGISATDSDRDVQISALILMGHLRHIDVLNALIEALQRGDFAIQYHAEQSLIELTGVSNERSYSAWRAWLQEKGDPFSGGVQ